MIAHSTLVLIAACFTFTLLYVERVVKELVWALQSKRFLSFYVRECVNAYVRLKESV